MKKILFFTLFLASINIHAQLWKTLTPENTSTEISSSDIQLLAVDTSDNLIFVSDRKLLMYDGTKFSTLATFNSSYPQRFTNLVVSDKNVIYTTSFAESLENGYSYLDSTLVDDFGADPHSKLVAFKDGFILEKINGGMNFIQRYNISTASSSNTSYVSPSHFWVTPVTSLYMDFKGLLWKGSDGSGVSTVMIEIYDNSAHYSDYGHYTTSDGLINDSVTTIFQSSDSAMWIGTVNGISKFVPSTGKWTNYTTEDGLIDKKINCIAEYFADPDKFISLGIMIGTDNGLVSISNTGQITSYTTENGLISNKINSLAFCKGHLWVATPEGLMSYKDGKWASYKNNGLVDHAITCLNFSDSIKWFGTENGASKLQNNIWTSFGQGNSPLTDVHSIATDSKGTIWFLSKGLHSFDGTTWKTYNKALPYGMIAIDKNDQVWISSSGLYKVTGDTIQRVDSLKLLSGSHSIAIDSSNNVWVVSRDYFNNQEYENALFKYDGTELKKFQTNLFLNSVNIDDYNNIWISTSYGMYKFVADTFQKVKTRFVDTQVRFDFTEIDSTNKKWFVHNMTSFGYFTEKDSLVFFFDPEFIKGEIIDIAFDKDEKVWMATRNGLVVYANNAYVELSEENITFDWARDSVEIEISSNTTWKLSDNDVSWISTSKTSGSGNEKLKIYVTGYYSTKNKRSTTIEVLAQGLEKKYISVSQNAKPITTIENNVLGQVEIFPNPASELVQIKNLQEGSTVTIYDLEGKVKLTKKISSSEASLDLKEYQKGIYILQISTFGSSTYTKLIKN